VYVLYTLVTDGRAPCIADNGINNTLTEDEVAVSSLVKAEYKRGQASCGVGANLEPGLSGDCSYFWSKEKFSQFVDWVDTSSGLVELSVFPAGMSNFSTAGSAEYYKDGLRKFLRSKAPPAPPP
jgi:hypothetical protein